MSQRTIGWSFVLAQAVLLGALVFLPVRDDWPTPGWLTGLGFVVILTGLVAVAIAAIRLGSALTPTPVPTETGHLTTDGLYRYVRHPIYTGVLAIVAGLAVRSGSLATLAVAVVTVAFFNRKAAWEEAKLAERYPDYPTYARQTPRFVPRYPGRGFSPGTKP